MEVFCSYSAHKAIPCFLWNLLNPVRSFISCSSNPYFVIILQCLFWPVDQSLLFENFQAVFCTYFSVL